MDEMLQKRSMLLKNGTDTQGLVIYWMSRDQRVEHNWALTFAFQLAKENNKELAVLFCITKEFLGATARHYGFMLKGLEKAEATLRERNIPLYMLTGDPVDEITQFCKQFNVSHLVTDFDPLKIKRTGLQHVIAKVDSFVITVDAHNIVPAFVVSGKAEYGAYTLRPKVNKLLPVFMDSYPELPSVNKITLREFPSIDWEEVRRTLCTDLSVSEVDWCLPGEDEARKMLHHFVEHKLEQYASKRNDPVAGATSGLSPYLHFGQIS
ncbi:MAG TPA: deoxyribodipyrimidine photo-lyase, partial [Bacteroidales bacterium]|nr:deoxyribodipyrimidine photo-lyase [Bacteroidales bacterium]